MENSKFICFCNSVSKNAVQTAIQEGCRDFSSIYDKTGAGTGPCGGSCRVEIRQLLEASLFKPKLSPLTTPTQIPEPLVEAVSLFNRRYYWETHEVLETAWMDEQGPLKLFYQGVIQAAAAFYHVLNGNPKGMIKLGEESLRKLQAYRPQSYGLELETLCEALEHHCQDARKILGGEIPAFDYNHLPQLRLGSDMDIPSGIGKTKRE